MNPASWSNAHSTCDAVVVVGVRVVDASKVGGGLNMGDGKIVSRGGVAGSSLGIALSMGGLTAAGALAATSGYSCSASDPPGCSQSPERADRKLTAALGLVIVSPIALGVSIWGLVRSKRKLENTRKSRFERNRRLH